MIKPTVIAVDFDGTCVSHAYPDVGRDIGAVPVLKDLVAAGHKLILWTMRSGQELDDAVRWFARHEIPLFGVNENPTQKGWTVSPKCYAEIYIDDAALGAPLREGDFDEGNEVQERPFIDWNEVRRLLL